MPFVTVFDNRCLWASVTAWFLAQALKIPISWLLHEDFNLKSFFRAGGMPSSHSALVVAVSIMVGYTEGWNSALFAVSCSFASIVMYDAAGVRRETGRQGKAINQILQYAIFQGRPITDQEMKEIVGHTPLEVLGGMIVGGISAFLWIVVF